MKAESKPIPADLMIGNWIFNGEEYTQFKYYRINKIYHTYGWFVFDAEENIGIPITPEILEKAEDFNRNGYTHPTLWIDSDCSIDVVFSLQEPHQDTGGKYQVWVFVNSVCIRKLDYLHDLQNCFYQITEKPLNLTL